MLLRHLKSKQCALLPSGILIVEPDAGLLAARVLLLSAADFYVGLWGPDQLRASDSGTVVVAAVLSQTLGGGGLAVLAKNIRKLWPKASILILGDAALELEAALYDAVIDSHSRPETLLVALTLLGRTRWAMDIAPHNQSAPITSHTLENGALPKQELLFSSESE